MLVSAAAMSNFLIAFDINMVNIALPTMAAHFQMDLGTAAWVVIVHGIVLCSLLLPFGRAGDVIGHRRLFITGMGLFAAANLAVGLGYMLDSFLAVVVLRSFSAVGAAMMLSVNFAIMSVNLPAGMRGRGLGWSAVFGSMGFMTGPIVSGVMLSYLPWSSLFFLLFAIAVPGLFLAARHIPHSGGGGSTADIPQTAAFFAVILFSVLAINRGVIDGLTAGVALSALAAAAAAAVVVRRQKSAKSPLLEPNVIFNTRVMRSLFSMSLLYMCYSGSMVILPFYLQDVRGLDTAAMGMMFLIPAVLITFLGPASGRASDYRGSYGLTLGAAAAMVAAMLLFLSLGRLDMLLIALAGLILMGVSYGGFNAPNNRRVFSSVPVENLGTTSGTHQTMRHTGNVLGAATMPAVYQFVVGPSLDPAVMLDGFQAAFQLGLVFAVAAMLLTATISRQYRA